MKRRDFMKLSGTGMAITAARESAAAPQRTVRASGSGAPRRVRRSGTHKYNGTYTGECLDRIAMPIGGIGAGMICLEGTGAISHVSVRNHMDFFNAPQCFSAVHLQGVANGARLLEGPVPDWKFFGAPETGRGAKDTSFGFPRFHDATFQARFPFGEIKLEDRELPVSVTIRGWSPFVPGEPDSASLPVGALEYTFSNKTNAAVEAIFSFHTRNFMQLGKAPSGVLPLGGQGFILHQDGSEDAPEEEGDFAIAIDNRDAVVDHCWFKGGWRDSLTLVWNNIEAGKIVENPPGNGAPGASLALPITVPAGGSVTVPLLFGWYVPITNMRLGADAPANQQCGDEDCCGPGTFVPWYAKRFPDINGVMRYWSNEYSELLADTQAFTDTFYDSSLPPEALEAAAANLTILKSPTVLREEEGRLWAFEGCSDSVGCCIGSCTHVWNYAQAIPHLFPSLERSLRETEFLKSQNEAGHQTFRSALPIRHTAHNFHAASDGQLGGIMKVHREWRISGDTRWLLNLWPKVKASLAYCIATWDPRHRGLLEEPHHNTYDIEFWGPDGMCTSFYLGALAAAIEMATAIGDDTALYEELLAKGRKALETELFDGEYFYQRIMTDGLTAKFQPIATGNQGPGYKDIIAEVNEQGPKYQYGTGCISDGVLGFWMARMCGIEREIIDPAKLQSNLAAIHKYNLIRDLSKHANPQRPTYAMGDDGGLLLCSWPKGGELAIPFVYSDEVWTGIEYQVASHLILEGMVDEGLEIVRVCRDRYNGVRRNPFNEYECGHWYARALSSYGLLQALTGVRYDGLDKVLYIDSRVGPNFRTFLSTEHGYGTVSLKNGKPKLEVRHGTIEVKRCVVSGEEMMLA